MVADIRVLVVDDSAVVRTIITDSISRTSGMKVVGTASNGREALEQLKSSAVDVVTLDVQMPEMDGLATLDALMAARPLPVIMVSSLTRRGGATTLEAMQRGAVDYVAKPDYGAQTKHVLQTELPRKIRLAAVIDIARLRRIRGSQTRSTSCRPQPTLRRRLSGPVLDPARMEQHCIAIGVSTGGPPALSRLFADLTPPLPPIVVVQHMPASFTKPLAWRLDALSPLTIKEACHGARLAPNQVLIAPGGKHLELRKLGSQVQAVVRDGPNVSGHKPSVDVLMESVARCYGERSLGVIMTGMGRDGVAGCAAIKAAGGVTLGQDETSSEVYGMNKAAFVEGHIDEQFPLEQAAGRILRQIHHAARALH